MQIVAQIENILESFSTLEDVTVTQSMPGAPFVVQLITPPVADLSTLAADGMGLYTGDLSLVGLASAVLDANLTVGESDLISVATRLAAQGLTGASTPAEIRLHTADNHAIC